MISEAEKERVLLERGDLLVVEGNGSPDQIGRAALWRGEISPCTHQNHLIRMRPGDDIHPEFLELIWNAPSTIAQLKRVASTTSGLYTLSTKKVAAVEIPVPALEVQREIVSTTKRLLDTLVSTASAFDAAALRAMALRRSVVAAGVAGRLTVQNAFDEPADLLLTRISAVTTSTRRAPKRVRTNTVRTATEASA